MERFKAFKVGDRVRLADYTMYPDHGRHDGQTGVITRVEVDRVGIRWSDGQNSAAWFDRACYPILVDESQNKLGEEEMTNEEVKNPEYIIIVKNTETYKKGGVFKNYSDIFWSPKNVSEAYHVRPYDTDYIRPEAGRALIDKKIAVEAVKFNPEFVTLEQEAVLTKALADMSKKKFTVKKAPAKKPAAKKGVK